MFHNRGDSQEKFSFLNIILLTSHWRNFGMVIATELGSSSSLALESCVNTALKVAVIAPDVPTLYDAPLGVPMAGAVVNCVNIRLNAHPKSEVVMVDQEFFFTLVEEALKMWAGNEKNFKPPLLVVISDKSCDPKSLKYALGRGAIEYEEFLESGDPELD